MLVSIPHTYPIHCPQCMQENKRMKWVKKGVTPAFGLDQQWCEVRPTVIAADPPQCGLSEMSAPQPVSVVESAPEISSSCLAKW